jgi:predicted acylesterase/phospholipase RssA
MKFTRLENTTSGDTSVQEFRILSIDGGGFKGLFSACVLREFERTHGSLTGHFDMLCGTSTGGLIALALASGRGAEEIVNFYKVWGPGIFPEPGMVRRFLRRLGLPLTNSRNSDDQLKPAVESILGDKLMREANSYLCIPTISLITSSPWVYKTDHDESLTRDSEMLMKDVALATSAAPFYFPVATTTNVPGGEYVDGGLWANNPALVGLVEAGRFFVGADKPYRKVRILSIASVSPASGRPSGGRRRLSPLFSAKEIFTATLESQQKAADHLIRFIIPSLSFEVDYIRIPSPVVALEHCAFIGLDIANARAIETLEYYGRMVGQEWNTRPEITGFFSAPALPPVFRTIAKGAKANG